MASLSLQNIRKVYPGNVEAVKGIHVEIEDKEFIVLVGPSGCGKSTTLRMIAGLEDITEGDLFIDGEKVNDTHPKDRDIAMVFQNYALYPHMSVYDNMAFGLKIKKTPKEEINRRVKEAARILEIEDLLERKPKALSGGQRQRVALGRAMVREPKVFLMDEPLSNLDAKLRVQMRSEITKLHQRLDTTFIYVTHDQTEAMTMGTRIVIMDQGDVIQIASPQELYSHPRNVFVARFIGSPQMNLFTGTVIEEDGKYVVQIPDGTKLQVTEAREQALRDGVYLGKKVFVGMRPENLHESEIDPLAMNYAILRSTVEVAEHMGSETYLYMTIAGENTIARVDPKTTKEVGDEVELHIHYNRIHVFDRETELSIC